MCAYSQTTGKARGEQACATKKQRSINVTGSGKTRHVATHAHFNIAYSHNIAKLVFIGGISLSSISYYVYRRGYGLTSPQKVDLFERSWRPERAVASPRSLLLGGAN